MPYFFVRQKRGGNEYPCGQHEEASSAIKYYNETYGGRKFTTHSDGAPSEDYELFEQPAEKSVGGFTQYIESMVWDLYEVSSKPFPNKTHEMRPSNQAHTGSDSIPGSDRMVRLDHNGDPYKAAVAALDRALAEFRNDHYFGNSWKEKSALTATLERGRELLKGLYIKISDATETIINPLNTIIRRYEKEVIAGTVTALATVAFELLAKLFGFVR